MCAQLTKQEPQAHGCQSAIPLCPGVAALASCALHCTHMAVPLLCMTQSPRIVPPGTDGLADTNVVSTCGCRNQVINSLLAPSRWRTGSACLQIDTPTDTPARDRFARYRGLKSWRSSPWDAREGLPQEYANTFAFENFKRAHKR